MGWTVPYNEYTRAELVAYLCDAEKAIDHSVVGNTLYMLAPSGATGVPVIYVFLLSKFEKQGYGYKDMDEGMFPYSFDCPERILKASQIPDASGWRAECRRVRAAKREITSKICSLVVGDWYTFETELQGETRWQYACTWRYGAKRATFYWYNPKSGGLRYRLTKKQLALKYKPVASTPLEIFK